MWRALAYLVLLAVAAFGAVWIADRPGTVTLVWNGYQVGTSLALAIVGVIAVAIALGFVWAFIRGMIGLPEALVRGSAERRRTKGLSALSRGMIAVGSGDPLAAKRYAGDAERLLGTEPLTLLLKAQAAQISGDRDGAERAFQAMADDPETRVLGLRGLFVEARRRDDEIAARAYASEAARLAPSVTWANDAMLEAHCADTDWTGALETVERRASLGLIDKQAAKRQRAVLLTAIARDREAGEPEAAAERALQAVKLAPGLVPAACLAGRLLARRGDLKKAARVVEAAWRVNPHPDLTQVYLGLRTGDSVRDRLARAENLAKISSWDPEARLAVAQAALDAREFGRAREAIQPLTLEGPTVRTCLMMAAIEEAEHGAQSGRAREWLSRAARAPRDPLWIADGVASQTWEPVSPISGQLDAFTWQAPPNALGAPGEPMDPEEDEPQPGHTLVAAPASAGAPANSVAKPILAEVKADKPAASDPISAGMAAAALPVSGASGSGVTMGVRDTSKPLSSLAPRPEGSNI